MGEPTAGQRLIEAAREALAWARGEDNGCTVHEVLIVDGKPQVQPADLGRDLPQTVTMAALDYLAQEGRAWDANIESKDRQLEGKP